MSTSPGIHISTSHSPWEEIFTEHSQGPVEEILNSQLSSRFVAEIITMEVVQLKLLKHFQKKKGQGALKNKCK